MVGVALAACSDAPPADAPPASTSPASTSPAEHTASPTAGPFEVQGTVQAVAEDGSRVSVAHEDVPDYMPAMTMPFFAGAPGQLEGLGAGDRVSLRFERRGDGKHYLLRIAPIE